MRDLILERNKLYHESLELDTLSKEEGKKSFKIKEIQTEKYKKWKFYDEFIKAKNKSKGK